MINITKQTVPNSPPKNPSQVFLGEITGAILCLPNNIPNIYAKVSEHIGINTKINNVVAPLTITV
jgi:hypothetical protein